MAFSTTWSTFDSGLFGFRTRRVAPLDAAAFAKLVCTTVTRTGSRFTGNYKEAQTTLDASIQEVLVDAGLAVGIVPTTARLEKNENFVDVLVFTHDDVSKTGLVFIDGKGIYEVSNSEYSWRKMQDLDLVFGFPEADTAFAHLQMESLK